MAGQEPVTRQPGAEEQRLTALEEAEERNSLRPSLLVVRSAMISTRPDALHPCALQSFPAQHMNHQKHQQKRVRDRDHESVCGRDGIWHQAILHLRTHHQLSDAGTAKGAALLQSGGQRCTSCPLLHRPQLTVSLQVLSVVAVPLALLQTAF